MIKIFEMKKRILLVILAGSLLVGCGNEVSDETVEQQDDIEEVGDEQTDEFTYESLSNVEFLLSSGAGAWGTTLTINTDGTFEGVYHDSEMGESADEYPDGTVYFCSFSGKFGELEKVEEYVYKAELENLTYDNEAGTEEIEDNIRYVYSDPYGLTDSNEFYFYLPGYDTSKFTEDMVYWIDYRLGENESLPFYVLYNENTGETFSSTDVTLVEEQTSDETETSTEAEDLSLKYTKDTGLFIVDDNTFYEQIASNPIDENYAIDYESTMGTVESAFARRAKWQEQIDFTMSNLKDELTSDEYADVQGAYDSWEKYYENQLSAEQDLFYIGGIAGSSMTYADTAVIAAERTEQFADELLSIEFLKTGKIEYIIDDDPDYVYDGDEFDYYTVSIYKESDFNEKLNDDGIATSDSVEDLNSSIISGIVDICICDSTTCAALDDAYKNYKIYNLFMQSIEETLAFDTYKADTAYTERLRLYAAEISGISYELEQYY